MIIDYIGYRNLNFWEKFKNMVKRIFFLSTRNTYVLQIFLVFHKNFDSKFS